MKKKGLLMVIVLLAMASFMAAMAYSSAKVTNAAQLKVVNTDQALLTLEDHSPWSWQSTVGSKDKTVVVKDGELFFQFGKGINGGTGAAQFYGLQPNSEYTWNYLFTIRNKSAETLKLTVRLDGPFAQYITLGTTTGQGSGANWGTKGQPLVIDTVPPETRSGMQNIRNIALKIEIPSGHPVSATELLGSIIVEAEAK